MKNLKTIQSLLVCVALFAFTFYAQGQDNGNDVNPLSVLESSTDRTINGTTTYDGLNAGQVGNYGSYFGASAGFSITAGTFYNTFMGSLSGYLTDTGNYNTFLGTAAGYNTTSGNFNTAVGFVAGFSNVTGERNVFLGSYAGFGETGSDKLYIENSTATTPLIYGDFATNKVGINTKNTPNSVGGANTSAYTLYVQGGILTEELRVRTGWADYVFEKSYELMSLTDLEAYIANNGHLPNVPSASTVEAQGIEFGEITRIQQEKIEELTLYIIDLQKQLNTLQQQVEDLSKQ